MSVCLTCGACCSSFRVSFYRGEPVPDEWVAPVSPFLVAMRREPGGERCVALRGAVGAACRCAIYPIRSSTCREFTASWEDGRHHPECDRARARHGLPPLRPEDHEGTPEPEYPATGPDGGA